MDESLKWLFISGLLVAIVLIAVGLLLIRFGNKVRENGKKNLAQMIVGWIIFVLSVLAAMFGFIVFIREAGGITGIYIYLFIAPIFILGGFIACTSVGISSLVQGYQRDKEGKMDTGSIVRGWSLVILSIAVVVVIIITLAVLLNNYSSAQGDKPIRMM